MSTRCVTLYHTTSYFSSEQTFSSTGDAAGSGRWGLVRVTSTFPSYRENRGYSKLSGDFPLSRFARSIPPVRDLPEGQRGAACCSLPVSSLILIREPSCPS